MTEKQFTMEEIYTTTNKLFIFYAKLFKNGQISFAEYTLVENTIVRIQKCFEEMVNEND